MAAFKLFDKLGSALLGTRIRGIYFTRANIICGKTIKELSIFHLLG
jgi:hypothetical protein